MSANSSRPPRPGSLRSLLGGVFSLLLTRIELLVLEADEQKDALLFSLLLGGLALILILVGLLSALLLVLVLTPDSWRPLLLGGLMLCSTGGGVALLWQLRQRARRSPSPFTDTLTEVRKDWDSLSGKL